MGVQLSARKRLTNANTALHSSQPVPCAKQTLLWKFSGHYMEQHLLIFASVAGERIITNNG